MTKAELRCLMHDIEEELESINENQCRECEINRREIAPCDCDGCYYYRLFGMLYKCNKALNILERSLA